MAISNAQVPAEGTMTATGAQDDFDFGNAGVLRCNNASLVTLRGLLAGRPGQFLTIVSVGSGQVDIANDDTNSSAANRILNGVSGTISLAAGLGRCQLVYDGTTGRWRVIDHEQGAWITPSFSSADYTGNGAMTWTVDSGDVTSAAYYLKGSVLQFALEIDNSSVGGTLNTELQRTLPGGFTAFRSVSAIYYLRNNGSFATTGIATVSLGETVVRLLVSSAFPNWQASTNLTNVSVSLTIPVQ